MTARARPLRVVVTVFALVFLTLGALTACNLHGRQADQAGAPPIAQEELARAPAENRARLLSPALSGGRAPGIAARAEPFTPPPVVDRENYAPIDDNPLRLVREHPVSTFSVDVDTGSYANMRRFLAAGSLPRQDAIRVEELINYFDYDYPAPADPDTPFSITTEIAPSPWNADRYLLHVGLKGFEQARTALPPANLVFLVDVSGSMQSPDKLALLKAALRMLVTQMREQDRISLVVYAGASGVVLEPTSGREKARIMAALDGLEAGGSTNGAAGIRLAYSMARQGFIEGGINRVLLATDGDFNVGTVNHEALVDLIEAQRKQGITLTTLGFGSGNYNDRLMEQLADHGDGNYAYIDSIREAQKVLVEEMASTLLVIAKDVKIQIEFNPEVVAEYRLIGYENRVLAREDFNNDRVDAGEIGAGHTVTALYELRLVGQGRPAVDPLRYRQGEAEPATPTSGEIAFLKLRYKQPDGGESRLLTRALKLADIQPDLAASSARFRFSAAVAAFGQLLRGGRYLGDFGYAEAHRLAREARGADRFGYRGEFLGLVKLAQALDGGQQHAGR